MPGVSDDRCTGVLRRGWNAMVDDYAIAGGWTHDGAALVIADSGGGVHVFEGKSGDRRWSQANGHDGGVLAVAMRPDDARFATAGQDGDIRFWTIDDDQPQHAVDAAGAWVDNLAWSPNGQQLAASRSRQVRAYRPDGEEIWRSDDHPSTVSAIAWSGAGELATASYGRVTYFDAATGAVRQKLEWQGSLISLVLSPDGDIIACGSQDNSVHFWRRSTGEDSMMSGYSGKPASLAFDASGSLLATGGGEAVTVWSFHGEGPEGTRPGVLELHNRPVSALAFERRGVRLASGARDGTVVVWSLQVDGNGEPVGVALLQDTVAALYWRPDGRALAALDAQGGVTVWRVG